MKQRVLNVKLPSGRPIFLKIHDNGISLILITKQPIPEVEKDNPPFAVDGIIKFSCLKTNYVEVVNDLEIYLSQLFQGDVDETIYSSLGANIISTGNQRTNIKRKAEPFQGERSAPGLHPSSRGNKSTESNRPGIADSSVAESGDSPIKSED